MKKLIGSLHFIVKHHIPYSTSTWFKDHMSVFTDPAQLGKKHIAVSVE